MKVTAAEVIVVRYFGQKVFPRGSSCAVKRRYGGRRLVLKAPNGAKAGLLINAFPRSQRIRFVDAVIGTLAART